MKDEDIRQLANLARIEITDEEVKSYKKEFTDILGYVDQIKNASTEDGGQIESVTVRNVFREDAESHESGLYTEDILNSAPESKDGYVKVQKVLNTDNAGA